MDPCSFYPCFFPLWPHACFVLFVLIRTGSQPMEEAFLRLFNLADPGGPLTAAEVIDIARKRILAATPAGEKKQRIASPVRSDADEHQDVTSVASSSPAPPSPPPLRLLDSPVLSALPPASPDPRAPSQPSLFALGIARNATLADGTPVVLHGEPSPQHSTTYVRCIQCGRECKSRQALAVHQARAHSLRARTFSGDSKRAAAAAAADPEDSETDDVSICSATTLSPAAKRAAALAPAAMAAAVAADRAVPTPPSARRAQYTYADKAAILDALDEALTRENPAQARALVTAERRISKSMLCRWEKDKVRIYAENGNKFRKHLVRPRRSEPAFPKMEFELIKMFQQRRARGHRVSNLWLVTKARKLAAKYHPGRAFVASRGWLLRLAVRAKISPRYKTNCKRQAMEQRLPVMRKWHAGFRAMLTQRAENTAKQYTDKWGRFSPRLRFNADQVPLPFVVEQNRTWESKGSKSVWLLQPGGGALSKRQATLLLFFCADPSVVCRPAIIFRGMGKRIKASERAAWHPDIDVYFQAKAWADTPMMVAWAGNTMRAAVPGPGKEMALLLCDNLKAHAAEPFLSAARRDCNTLVWFYSANCTDVLQPVDAGYGRDVKREIGVRCAKWLEDDENLQQWEDGSLSASERRVLMTLWAAEAVAAVNASPERLRRYFEKTGSLMTADGSGDAAIQPQGTEGYSFAGVVADLPELKEEKKEDNAEGDDAEGDAEGDEEEDEEVEAFFDTDDDAQAGDEKDAPTMADAMPTGFCIEEQPPALNKSLVRRHVLFKFSGAGWWHGVVRQHYPKGRGEQRFNYEFDYPGVGRRDHRLLADAYCVTDVDGDVPAGSWAVLSREEG
jgi:hypothetical protein